MSPINPLQRSCLSNELDHCPPRVQKRPDVWLLALVITNHVAARNPSPNQQRNLKPTATTPSAYSASPSQLTLSSDLPSSALNNPYQQGYPYAPNPHDPPFGFPQQPQYRPPLQTQALPQLPPPQQSSASPVNSRKRRASDLELPGSSGSHGSSFGHPQGLMSGGTELGSVLGPSQTELPSPIAKKGRTNTPWTPAEEQRLKTLRDAGRSWNEIAKTFPMRTEGSVKKHWYKVRMTRDLLSSLSLNVNFFCRICTMRSLRKMRWATSFASLREIWKTRRMLTVEQSALLLQTIKDYQNNMWKVIGQKVGKPAKVRCV